MNIDYNIACPEVAHH